MKKGIETERLNSSNNQYQAGDSEATMGSRGSLSAELVGGVESDPQELEATYKEHEKGVGGTTTIDIGPRQLCAIHAKRPEPEREGVDLLGPC